MYWENAWSLIVVVVCHMSDVCTVVTLYHICISGIYICESTMIIEQARGRVREGWRGGGGGGGCMSPRSSCSSVSYLLT